MNFKRSNEEKRKKKQMNTLYINGGPEQRGKKQRERERPSKKGKEQKKMNLQSYIVLHSFSIELVMISGEVIIPF